MGLITLDIHLVLFVNGWVLTWPYDEGGDLQVPCRLGWIFWLRKTEPLLVDLTFGVAKHRREADRVAPDEWVHTPGLLVVCAQVEFKLLQLVLVHLHAGEGEGLVPNRVRCLLDCLGLLRF